MVECVMGVFQRYLGSWMWCLVTVKFVMIDLMFIFTSASPLSNVRADAHWPKLFGARRVLPPLPRIYPAGLLIAQFNQSSHLDYQHSNISTMDATHHSDIASWELLQELDPSPIDSPDPEPIDDPLVREDKKHELPEIVKDTAGSRPAGTRSPPSHVLGLSGLGGSHGAVYYCIYPSSSYIKET